MPLNLALGAAWQRQAEESFLDRRSPQKYPNQWVSGFMKDSISKNRVENERHPMFSPGLCMHLHLCAPPAMCKHAYTSHTKLKPVS